MSLPFVRRKAALSILLVCIAARLAQAGDAIAIGYNRDGVWTAVTYYSSGTAKGGADYKDEAAAREAALRDLQKRAGEDLATSKVLASSDRTGHVAYARGKSASGEDLHGVGYGASKDEAAQNALADLKRLGAMRQQKVIYNYFSHGVDAGRNEADASATKRTRP